jgi:hypothetical protein
MKGESIMIRVRKAGERGHFDHGWLDTWHTFSFGGYRDPEQMGFRNLRVINDDRVAPGQGFGMHPHENMEIVTYIVEGALEHRDSMGNGSVLRAGDLQRMSAGSGIRHSEFNPSKDEAVHLYQIWILPEHKGIEPSYEEMKGVFDSKGDSNLRLVASRGGANGAMNMNADASVYVARIARGEESQLVIEQGRLAWVQVVSGRVDMLGESLSAGDGAAISDERAIRAKSLDGDAEIIVFDLA